ncbi:MAG: hypothetical protein EB084_10735 [Proteobacteria bacterium]|nr:hypothetical protein [Pseudomonadota bacterium]
MFVAIAKRFLSDRVMRGSLIAFVACALTLAQTSGRRALSFRDRTCRVGPAASVLTDAGASHSVVRDGDGHPAAFRFPAAITRYARTRFFICNYADVALIDTARDTLAILPKPRGVGAWYPTGLCWSAKRDRLFVANYLAKDLLVLRFSPSSGLTLDARWHGPWLTGPEGVDVSRDGDRVAIADHDGHRLTLTNGAGTVLWSRHVPNCHGVSMLANGDIIATGLGDASIRRFSADGVEQRCEKRLGWGRGESLWPTGVAISPRGVIATSDAHNGRIRIVRDDLVERQAMGGNGLSDTLFNMPYGLCWDGDRAIVVTDTFKSRLLEIDPYARAIKAVHAFEPPALAPGQGLAVAEVDQTSRNASPSRLGKGYHQWQGTQQISLAIPLLPRALGQPQAWRLDYGKLTALHDPLCLHADAVSSLYSGSYLYFLEARSARVDGTPYVLLWSPQAPGALVIDGQRGVAASVYLAHNVWPLGERLTSGTQSVAVDDVMRVGIARIEHLAALRDKGVEPLRAVREALFSQLDADTFTRCFASSFLTPAGNRLVDQVLRDGRPAVVRAAIDAYAASLPSAGDLQLSELLIVQSLRLALPPDDRAAKAVRAP